MPQLMPLNWLMSFFVSSLLMMAVLLIYFDYCVEKDYTYSCTYLSSISNWKW